MHKFIVGSMFALALLVSPVAAFAAPVPTDEPTCLAEGGTWDAGTSECAMPREHNGSSVTACYYLLGIGAQWCDNTDPTLRSLWAQQEVREFIVSLFLATR